MVAGWPTMLGRKNWRPGSHGPRLHLDATGFPQPACRMRLVGTTSIPTNGGMSVTLLTTTPFLPPMAKLHSLMGTLWICRYERSAPDGCRFTHNFRRILWKW